MQSRMLKASADDRRARRGLEDDQSGDLGTIAAHKAGELVLFEFAGRKRIMRIHHRLARKA